MWHNEIDHLVMHFVCNHVLFYFRYGSLEESLTKSTHDRKMCGKATTPSSSLWPHRNVINTKRKKTAAKPHFIYFLPENCVCLYLFASSMQSKKYSQNMLKSVVRDEQRCAEDERRLHSFGYLSVSRSDVDIKYVLTFYSFKSRYLICC